MPQQTIDLAYAARLPPKEAVAYFRAKGYNITWNWYEQLADAHARAFTVAKATRMDVLTTIREEVERAVSEGITREEFTRTLAPPAAKTRMVGKTNHRGCRRKREGNRAGQSASSGNHL